MLCIISDCLASSAVYIYVFAYMVDLKIDQIRVFCVHGSVDGGGVVDVVLAAYSVPICFIINTTRHGLLCVCVYVYEFNMRA